MQYDTLYGFGKAVIQHRIPTVEQLDAVIALNTEKRHELLKCLAGLVGEDVLVPLVKASIVHVKGHIRNGRPVKGYNRRMETGKIKETSKKHFAELPDGYVEGGVALSSVDVVDDAGVIDSFLLYSDDSRPDAPYAQINTALWSGEPVPAEFAGHVENIQNYIERHPIGRGIRVQRGVDPRHYGFLLEGDVSGYEFAPMPAFISTSVTDDVAKKFADGKGYKGKKLIQVLDIPKGHPAVNMSNSTKYAEEEEILLPRHTRIAINGRIEKDGYVYLYCEVLPWKK